MDRLLIARTLAIMGVALLAFGWIAVLLGLIQYWSPFNLAVGFVALLLVVVSGIVAGPGGILRRRAK